jgi:hypothetical protein
MRPRYSSSQGRILHPRPWLRFHTRLRLARRPLLNFPTNHPCRRPRRPQRYHLWQSHPRCSLRFRRWCYRHLQGYRSPQPRLRCPLPAFRRARIVRGSRWAPGFCTTATGSAARAAANTALGRRAHTARAASAPEVAAGFGATLDRDHWERARDDCNPRPTRVWSECQAHASVRNIGRSLAQRARVVRSPSWQRKRA